MLPFTPLILAGQSFIALPCVVTHEALSAIFGAQMTFSILAYIKPSWLILNRLFSVMEIKNKSIFFKFQRRKLQLNFRMVSPW